MVTDGDAASFGSTPLLDSGRPLSSNEEVLVKIPRSTDRRVLRTRAALREALLALIVERGWDAVGIRDICARATVGRSTFYTHFADKEELLFSGFDDLRSMLRASKRTTGSSQLL